MLSINQRLFKQYIVMPLNLAGYIVMLSGGALHAEDYEEGKQAYLDKDYAKALEIIRPLAESGDSQAQVTLGVMYDFGHGVEKDPGEAIKWYIKAAEQGIPIVQHDVGVKYFQGQGVEQDFTKAIYWWEQSASAGIADSQFNLGLVYYRGIGVDVDYPKASSLFAAAAKQDHANAQYSLAVMHAFGQGVQKDYQEALKWFRESADRNVPQAQFNLGVFYENGYGLEKDIAAAKEWYSLAANNGLDEANKKLEELQETPVAASKPPESDLMPQSEAPQLASTEPTPQKTQQQPRRERERPPVVSTGIKRGAWLTSQPRASYTLQLSSLLDERRMVSFLKEHGITGNAAYVKVLIKGKTRYNALYGSYRTREEAQRAIATLPRSLSNHKPWIRNIGALQDLLIP